MPVARKAVLTVVFTSIMGLAMAAWSGTELKLPNPFAAKPQQEAVLAAAPVEEAKLDSTLDELESELAALDPGEGAEVPVPGALDDQDMDLALAELESGLDLDEGTGSEAPAAVPLDEAEAMEILRDAELISSLTPEARALGTVPAAAYAGTAFVQAGDLASLPEILDPCAEGQGGSCTRAMDAFFRRLDRSKSAKVRMAIYGDSIIMGDQIIGALRTLLHKKFGSGGPGFIFPAKPARWYSVLGTIVFGDGWKIAPATESNLSDGLYGYGSHGFSSSSAGVTSRIECDARCPWSDVTDYEVYYLSQSDGGTFTVKAGKDAPLEVNTKGNRKTANFFAVKTNPGPVNIEITSGAGDLRIFGVSVENKGPGLVLDSLPMLGGGMDDIVKITADHWREQLKHREVNLVVLMFGTNATEAAHFSTSAYRKDLEKAVDVLKELGPDVSILLVSPPARGEKVKGEIRVKPAIKELNNLYREVAQERGCAWWSLYEAMGGDGGAAAWYNHQPRFIGEDLTHYTKEGADHMGKLMYAAILKSYISYKKRKM